MIYRPGPNRVLNRTLNVTQGGMDRAKRARRTNRYGAEYKLRPVRLIRFWERQANQSCRDAGHLRSCFRCGEKRSEARPSPRIENLVLDTRFAAGCGSCEPRILMASGYRSVWSWQ
jgi:hypothetical protein